MMTSQNCAGLVIIIIDNENKLPNEVIRTLTRDEQKDDCSSIHHESPFQWLFKSLPVVVMWHNAFIHWIDESPEWQLRPMEGINPFILCIARIETLRVSGWVKLILPPAHPNWPMQNSSVVICTENGTKKSDSTISSTEAVRHEEQKRWVEGWSRGEQQQQRCCMDSHSAEGDLLPQTKSERLKGSDRNMKRFITSPEKYNVVSL